MKRKILDCIINFLQLLIHKIFGTKNIILFSGQEGFDGSAKAIFEHIKKNYTNKYKYVWIYAKKSQSAELKGNGINTFSIKYENDTSTHKFLDFIYEIKLLYVKACSKYCFYENGFIPYTLNIPFRVYLTHGSPSYKDVSSYFLDATKKATHIIATSEQNSLWWNNFLSKHKKTCNTVICGLPRIDYIQTKKLLFSQYGINTKKVIIWMPTFRKTDIKDSEGNVRNDCDIKYLYGLPLVKTYDDLKLINKHCEERDLTLLIKPHPVAAKQGISDLCLSNIKVWTNELMEKQGIETLYSFFEDSAAMISDYSSVVFDYMFVNRPLAFVLDDFETYNNKLGFAFDNVKHYMPGEHIYTLEDMLFFIEHVSENIDTCKHSRNEVHSWANKFHDFKQSERFCELFRI